MYESIEDRVSNGVNWLNEAMPDWRSNIDIERLNLKNHVDCVLGQLDLVDRFLFNERFNYEGYGFDAKHDLDHEYESLKEQWIHEIENF
jgi:hypothetical protein